MTALYAEDCFALSNISRMLGYTAYAEELEARGNGLVHQINTNLVRMLSRKPCGEIRRHVTQNMNCVP